MKTLQERVDEMTADFSTYTCQQMALRDKLTELEQEAARQKDSKQGSKMAAETARKATDVRKELSAVQLKRDKTEKDLEEAQRQLLAKQGQLNSRKVTFAQQK